MEIEEGNREVQGSAGGEGKQRERVFLVFFFFLKERKNGEKQGKATKA